jgi:uncharacterized glyoxalase superfamily protein PhnB
MPRITPYLLYEDVASALEWLAKTFGLRERMRMPGPNGKVMHAEMELADGVVMMGNPGPDYRNPKRVGHVTQQLYVYVDDVDKHFEIAKGAGAKILAEPEDQFSRLASPINSYRYEFGRADRALALGQVVQSFHLDGDHFSTPPCCYGNDADCERCGAWIVFHLAARQAEARAASA